MDNCRAAQVKQSLSLPQFARSITLPPTDMRQAVFDTHALMQFGPPEWAHLPLAHLLQQPLIWRNLHTPPLHAQPVLFPVLITPQCPDLVATSSAQMSIVSAAGRRSTLTHPSSSFILH